MNAELSQAGLSRGMDPSLQLSLLITSTSGCTGHLCIVPLFPMPASTTSECLKDSTGMSLKVCRVGKVFFPKLICFE